MLFWDILLIVGGLAIMFFGNRMFNRSESDDWLGKIIWGIVLFWGISTVVLGVIATDARLASPPPKPEPEAQGQPPAAGPRAGLPGISRPTAPIPSNPMNATVKVTIVDAETGQTIPQVLVRLNYGPSSKEFSEGTDSTGTATFFLQPVGVNASITVEKYAMTEYEPAHAWQEGNNSILCKVSSTTPPTQPAPNPTQDTPTNPNSDPNPYPNSHPSTQSDPTGTSQPTDPSSGEQPADAGQRGTTAGGP